MCRARHGHEFADRRVAVSRDRRAPLDRAVGRGGHALSTRTPIRSLIGVFNAGHDRKFALVHRQVPLPEGGYRDAHLRHVHRHRADGDQKRSPPESMQSRCIVLAMKRADEGRGGAAGGVSTRATRRRSRSAVENSCAGRPTSTRCPEVGKVPGLINRIWLNWRPLLQIAAACRRDVARARTGRRPRRTWPRDGGEGR